MARAVEVERLTHTYPPGRGRSMPQSALQEISLGIDKGEIFGLIGPNGSGKSTLFRILSTLLIPTQGSARIFDLDVRNDVGLVRRLIGVVFQNPSLDKKLTVRENLLHQGHLNNLTGKVLRTGIEQALARFGLAERSNDLVEHLSGGLQRRVELAKAILHKPRVMILDEPSTGLDPGARRDFMNYLEELRKNDGVTVILTSHILDEAEKCDRIAILDMGKVEALGTPQELRREIGGDVISVTTKSPADLAGSIFEKFHVAPILMDNTLHIERRNGAEFIPALLQAFPGQIESVTLSKPTLEDVFIHRTGHKFWINGQ